MNHGFAFVVNTVYELKTIFLFTAPLLAATCFAQTHERWDVKTLTDGFAPDTNKVKKVTVAAIEAKHLVKVSNTQPRLKSEKQVVRITGTIKRIAPETGKGGDGDYHIEVSDDSMDSTFVCEAVDPGNADTKKSPYIDNFKKVRSVAVKLKVGDKVTFTGVLFQDKYHSPSELRTRNFVEMHPILKAKKK